MDIVCQELYDNCKPFLVMEDLVVHSDFIFYKIGSLLLKDLETIGKEKKCSQIIFITESDIKEKIAFYENLGFNSKTHVGFKRQL